jgi:glucose/mannose-6-phosphate isomerase
MQEIYDKLQNEVNRFPKQFGWSPIIENEKALNKSANKIAICGLGGSGLAANLLLTQPKAPNVRIHRDYWHDWLADMDLMILSSFSGNTEEVLDCLNHAIKQGVDVAISSNGGELIKIANEKGLPVVQLPAALQPRYAIGYSYIALSALTGVPVSTETGEKLSQICADTKSFQELAKIFAGKQMVYYSSSQNFATTYVWKILTNESAKQPSWANKLPEFNHNELQGYVLSDQFNLADNSGVVFITSNDDHPRNLKRVNIIAKQLADRDIQVSVVEINGNTTLEQAVYGWQAGMHFTLELARQNEVNPEEVKIIEDLKESLKS